MKKNAKISVIMGVYNPSQKEYFFRAVLSIVHQSFQDWELILYDDGSAKPYEKMIRQAVKLDNRIMYIRGEKNHGLAYALNQGIHYASGEYIARMDDDDIAKSDRLAKQYHFLELHPQYQWVGSSAELIDRYGVWGLQTMPRIPQKRDFLFNSPYIHPSVMFRKKVLTDHHGYRISKKLLQCEDYELFMRLHQNGQRGSNLLEPLLQYREDYESQKKKNYRRRIREMKVRYRGFYHLGILNKTTFYYVLKPLFVGAIPAPLHHYVRRQLKRQKGKLSREKR